MRRMIIGVIVATVAAVGIGGVAASLAVGSAVTSIASASPTPTCPPADPVTVGGITVPAGPVAGYCQPELINAAHVLDAAHSLGIGTRTQTVGIMTAIGESGLRNLTYGDAVGPDSRGLFQQRDNGAWGTLTDRMDPYTAAYNFFVAVTHVNGWQTMEPTLLAHAVQVNADPYHYQKYWAEAQAIVAALGG
ncbi:hypothetical protein [Microbacterium sp. CJ88]|uniref:hypothetical protein n=1 Tax=Microbacterium sp. CJ88 TaxID=3445672 RepID=UPI003F65CCAC